MHLVHYSGVSLLTYIFLLSACMPITTWPRLGQLSSHKCFIAWLLFIGKSSTKRHDLYVCMLVAKPSRPIYVYENVIASM